MEKNTERILTEGQAGSARKEWEEIAALEGTDEGTLYGTFTYPCMAFHSLICC